MAGLAVKLKARQSAAMQMKKLYAAVRQLCPAGSPPICLPALENRA